MTPLSRIARVRELGALSSPGPWEVKWFIARRFDGHGEPEHVPSVVNEASSTMIVDESSFGDCQFIAESHTLMPSLADDCEKMLAFLDEVIAKDLVLVGQSRTGGGLLYEGPLAKKARALKKELGATT